MAEYRVLGNGKKMLIETPRRVSAVHAISVMEAVGSAVSPGVAAAAVGSISAAIMGDARKPHPRFANAHEEEAVEKIDDATGEVVQGKGADVEVEPVLECAAEEEDVKVKEAETFEEKSEGEDAEAESSEGGELPLGDGKPEEGKKRRRRR